MFVFLLSSLFSLLFVLCFLFLSLLFFFFVFLFVLSFLRFYRTGKVSFVSFLFLGFSLFFLLLFWFSRSSRIFFFFFCSFVVSFVIDTRLPRDKVTREALLLDSPTWDLRLLRSYDRIPPCDHRRSSTSSSNLIDLFLLSVSSTACFIAFAKTSTATQLSSTEFSLARYLLSVFLVTDRFFRKLKRLRMHEADLKTPVVDYYRRVSFVSSHLVHLRSRIVDRLYCTCKKHKHNTICHSGVRTLVIGFLAIPTEP